MILVVAEVKQKENFKLFAPSTVDRKFEMADAKNGTILLVPLNNYVNSTI